MNQLNSNSPTKRRIIAFRVVTVILIVGMLAGGFSTIFRMEAQVTVFKHLGYPLFLMTIIGISKILAAIVLAIPGIPLLKISAYTGTFIVSVCALISHIQAGDELLAVLNPLILTTITLLALALNPWIRVTYSK